MLSHEFKEKDYVDSWVLERKVFGKYNRDVFKCDMNLTKYENYGILPTFCIHSIFLYLQPRELFREFQVCKLFHHISNTDHFWKEYYDNYPMRGKARGKTNTSASAINFKNTFFMRFFRSGFFFKPGINASESLVLVSMRRCGRDDYEKDQSPTLSPLVSEDEEDKKYIPYRRNQY